ncbi:MAG: hypothetical protein DRR16_17995 [Candidatus Parabeggiatoa sp. nov. 3]|nr:MAG: hypothetical protein DRR00_27475 [Gammaproteobacteria bacterium]RKZ58499.1 MAG: hypothetical protein DRQ99_25365 [Gammaproteobacteria bacterium]RKZ83151.1 MAG: hypothetical protein DRR16_17995 [Gammaproteobacteria bacterium]
MSFLKSFLKFLFRITLGVLIAIPLLLYPFLYFYQERLLFIPIKTQSEELGWAKKEYPHVEELQIKTPDNMTLHGYYLKNSPKQQSPLLIYFGGNSEDVSKRIWSVEYLKGWSWLVVNYRGYGLSEGSPSEKHLFQDAVLIYDTVAQRADIDNKNIVAFGRSLGTGVAVHLASQRPLKGVILVTPYDSIRSIVQEIYPYVPVSLLLKHHFDALALAPSIKVPMLAVMSQHDQVINHQHSIALIEAWGGVTHQTTMQNTDHNNVEIGEGYWDSISAFLNR